MFVISDVKTSFPNCKSISLLDVVFNFLLMSYSWLEFGTKPAVSLSKLICLSLILSTIAVACAVCSPLIIISTSSPFFNCDLSTSDSNTGVDLLDALYGDCIWKREEVL